MPKRNVYRWLALTIAVAIGVGFWLTDGTGRLGRQDARSEQPFAELPAAVAADVQKGWTIASTPKRSGPYRRTAEPAKILPSGTDGMVICRVQSGPQDQPEEIKLQAVPEADQMVVFLDTADGKRTAVVLRRPKP